MKFNYQLSFNFEGKNNHNFSNNEIKSHFFLFFVQKSCCVFAQFKKLLYICGKIRTCGRTQQNCLILIVVCAQLESTCDVLSIVAPREAPYIISTREATRPVMLKNNGRKNQNQGYCRESWRIRWNRRPSSARPSKRVETCTRQGRESPQGNELSA